MSRRPPPAQRPYDREQVPPPSRHYDDRGGNGRYASSSSSAAPRRSRSPDARGGHRDRDWQREREPIPSRPHGYGQPDRTVPPPRDYRSGAGYAPRDGRDGYATGYERDAPPGRGYVPPPREAAVSSSRDRERDREWDRDRPRERDGYRDERDARPSGKRDGGREREADGRGLHQGRNGDKAAVKTISQEPEAEEEAGEEEGEADQTEEDMMAAMGFGGFGTTKNHKVEGNATGSANVKKERTWRQYMNRKGGFNRPLDALPKDK